PFREVYDPSHPDADANGIVRYPNVNVAEQMVDMMNARRSYEANVAALDAVKEMALRALEISR
ncbi:MAG TPA: flagellar basal body rod protein FlgC, partial [Desulfurivibrio alkaliphilus]|nr:flagellar basal body rod protein FlgC [Desulfurivibrio alkaliphilus]